MVIGAAVLLAFVGTPPDLRAERSVSQQIAALPNAAAPDARPEAAPSDVDTADAEAPAEETEWRRTVKARRGDTFMKLLRSAGASRTEAYRAVTAMRKVYDPRDLDIDQALTVHFRGDEANAEEDGKGTLVGFRFRPSVEHTIQVSLAGEAFEAEKIEHALSRSDARMAGTIQSNLYAAASKAGVPPPVLADLIRLLSWDVDFQREIREGDTFDVMVERFDGEDGKAARWGDILFAELKLSGTSLRIYRHETKRNGVEYFDEQGRSAQKALMKTPINGARLSSGFGRRRHPILGYNRMHRGIDFAAPRGTPIYAAGSGRIDYAGRHGAYGRFVRIRHNGRYTTAYAHLKGFARGIRRGKRVRQGQVIGYVGSSGRSTGPHLHYEVRVEGRQVNPMRLKLPSGRTLAGKELAEFQSERVRLEERLAALPRTITVTTR